MADTMTADTDQKLIIAGIDGLPTGILAEIADLAPYRIPIGAAGEKTSRNGPRNFLSVDQSVTANTTSEK